jgi:ankyrin repeat protein
MSASLPEHPNLDQLRRQAKELRDAARRGEPGALDRVTRTYRPLPAGPLTLAAAQLIIARELGFARWPRLKAAVESRVPTSAQLAEAFVAASVEPRLREAIMILDAHPGVAAHSIYAAAVLGEARTVRAMLAADPSAAMTTDETRGWPPLLYACYSRWHQIAPARAAGMAEVARLLLQAGASPNTNNGARRDYRSALSGAVEGGNPDVARVLVEAGANPDDGQCIMHAAGQRDQRCLELLLSHGARVARTWAVGAAVSADSTEAVSLLVAALRASGQTATEVTEALPDAAADASPEVVRALLDGGADPQARDSETGLSALRRAVRAGQTGTAALLARHGAPDDSTDVDHFLGACRRADRAAAERLLAEHPSLPGRLTDGDRATLVDSTGSGQPAAVALSLDLGFSPGSRNGFGEQPLHVAAYHGNAEVVRLLIGAGAEVDAVDTRFGGTPLAYATVGSGERAGQPGDWVETVRLLIDAGASRDDVWISAKPPSEEIIAVLRGYGVTPANDSGPDGDDAHHRPLSAGTGVMADVAHHLEVAYRHLDLELLGSLLHPQVQWTGLCHTSAQVLDWYRQILADGTRTTVESTEVDRDAVVLGLTVSRPAEGARPAPAERLYQVFTVDNGEITEIRGYRDRASAFARS